MELDQKSTCSLREPTLLTNKNLKTFQSQKHHLVDSSDFPEEMRLGQLFLQCLSDLQAKQVPLLNRDLGRNAACPNWEGCRKDLTASSAPRRKLEA